MQAVVQGLVRIGQAVNGVRSCLRGLVCGVFSDNCAGGCYFC